MLTNHCFSGLKHDSDELCKSLQVTTNHDKSQGYLHPTNSTVVEVVVASLPPMMLQGLGESVGLLVPRRTHQTRRPSRPHPGNPPPDIRRRHITRRISLREAQRGPPHGRRLKPRQQAGGRSSSGNGSGSTRKHAVLVPKRRDPVPCQPPILGGFSCSLHQLCTEPLDIVGRNRTVCVITRRRSSATGDGSEMEEKVQRRRISRRDSRESNPPLKSQLRTSLSH